VPKPLLSPHGSLKNSSKIITQGVYILCETGVIFISAAIVSLKTKEKTMTTCFRGDCIPSLTTVLAAINAAFNQKHDKRTYHSLRAQQTSVAYQWLVADDFDFDVAFKIAETISNVLQDLDTDLDETRSLAIAEVFSRLAQLN
jgi:hypothetical protein